MANSGGARRPRAQPSSALSEPFIRSAEASKDLRELIAVRSELSARIQRKRRAICATFEEAGVPIAALLADASSGTIRTFLEANAAESTTSDRVRCLSAVLGLSAFSVVAALRNELSETQRFYLSVQLHRLDALAHALFCAELPRAAPRLTSIRRDRS